MGKKRRAPPTATATATGRKGAKKRLESDDAEGEAKIGHDDPRPRPSSSSTSIRISKSDHDSTLVLLQSLDWDMAKNTSRRNVIREDDPSTPRNGTKNDGRPYCMSFVFGRNMKDPYGGMSYWSTRYPNEYAELRRLMTRYVPNFAYTHITVNKNLRCKRHTDGGNAGPSYIAGFGNYRGGGLLIEPPGGGMPKTIYDLRGKFVMFDGRTQPHETMTFEGDRYTLVYYTSDMIVGSSVAVMSGEGGEEGGGGGGGGTIASSTTAGVSSDLVAKFDEIRSRLGNNNKKRKTTTSSSSGSRRR